jgi:hypothetical protein
MRTLSKAALGVVLAAAAWGLPPSLAVTAAPSGDSPAASGEASTPEAAQSGDAVLPGPPALPGHPALPGDPAPKPEPSLPPTTTTPAPAETPGPTVPRPGKTADPKPSPSAAAPATPSAPADPSIPAAPKAAPQADFAPLTITSHSARDVYVTGLTTLAGTATPGGLIVATNQWGTSMGSATADEQGNWRILRNLGPTVPSYVVTLVQTADGRTDTRQIELVYVATNVPVTVTSHADGEFYDAGVATFTGTGTVGATLTATNQWGTRMGATQIGANGTWSFSRNLGPADPGYVLTFTSSKGAELRSTTITLNFPELVPLTITSPDISSGTIDRADEHVVFTGTGTPFATLTGVNQWGTPFGDTKVDKNGHWEFRRWVAAGTRYEVTFTQHDAADKILVSDPFAFTSITR